MNIEYCYKYCEKGKKASENFLEKRNSPFDAALDFQWFIEECLKNCPYKKDEEKV